MAVEFYMFDDELWFIKDGTENQALSEKDTEVIKKMIDVIRERYPKPTRLYLRSIKRVQ